MKTYINPSLRVMTIKPADIIVTSFKTTGLDGIENFGGDATGKEADAASRFRDWDY